MKILFAVNNDNVSEVIAKKYQNEYKEILSYKNVYYFNAIIRELQKDKTYSRIVISEDLEPFANNNYESIDKFLFDKYSHISEEAKNFNNENIDIILICADRRKKTDSMLPKLFKLNIYNAIIGQDRSINEVCRLINGPRDREEAKSYYAIQESELAQTEGEDNVSEAEVENIRAHYARLGRNEDKYVESFNNIVSQYTDTQLKIIIKYLPMNVKAVLEERSPKYQQLVTTSVMDGSNMKLKAERYKVRIKNQPDEPDERKESNNTDVVEQFIKPRNIKSVVIPTDLKTNNVRKVTVPKVDKSDISIKDIVSNPNMIDDLQEKNIQPKQNNVNESDVVETIENILEKEPIEAEPVEIEPIVEEPIEVEPIKEDKEKIADDIAEKVELTDVTETTSTDEVAEQLKTEEQPQPKRGRGRPRKVVPVDEVQENKPKRGRGRPRKHPIETENTVMPESTLVTESTEQTENAEIEEASVDSTENLNADITENFVEDIKEPEVIENEVIVDEITENENTENNKEEVDLFNLDGVEEEKQKEEINLFDLDEPEETNELQEIISDEDSLKDNKKLEDQDESDVNLFDINEDNTKEKEVDLFGFKDDNDLRTETSSNNDEDIDLFNISSSDSSNLTGDKNSSEDEDLEFNNFEEKSAHQDMINTNYSNQTYENPNFASLLTADKKIVVFVGTTKNGTSFVVNNTAEMLSSMGIDTAILDMTKSKNSYYIYTNNEERLRETARTCMNNLQNGKADGIRPHKNLAIYTEMPGEEKEYNIDTVLATLVNNYSAILIDADFDTPEIIFERAQEIYLVQTMDVLTIQPLTAFLRNLKSKNILKQEKLRIVINKSERIKSLNIKTLIGGMANYNAPNMTYMTELFDKDHIRFCEIPFETENYVKYLEYLVICSINLNGYTKQLLTALRELANSVYPLLSGRDNYQPLGRRGNREPFTNEVNNTLNRMKSNY